MKKILLAAAVALAPALSLTGQAAAQEVKYGTEVCINASGVAEAKRLFPNAILHVLPDFTNPDMNGWRIVNGYVGAGGNIMTVAQEIQLRRQEITADLHRVGE